MRLAVVIRTGVIALIFALALYSVAHAQSALLQGGPWTPGHMPQYVGQGSSQPVVIDGGGASGGTIGANPSELGLTIRNPQNVYPAANVGSGPFFTNLCSYDAPITNPTGYHYLCFGPNSNGAGVIAYGAGGTASQLPFEFIVDGVTYSFPFSSSGVVGPSTTIVGDFALWNNTVGTLLKDATAGAGVVTALGLTPSGTGVLVLANGATLIGPALGTIVSGNLAAGTGYLLSNLSGLGSGVATALALTANTTGGIVTDGQSVGGLTFAQPDTGAVTRTALAHAQDFLDVLDFLPVGQPDGSTDNSAGFQAAATAMCARSSFGGTIVIPSPPNAAQYKAHDINNTCGNTWVGGGVGGVGSSNQTTTSSIVRGGASIDYSGASSYFMKWAPTGFPAFRSSAHLNGGGISHVSLFDGSSSTTALIVEGTQDWNASNIVMNGAYNGVFMKGDEFPVTKHISMYGTRNKNYEIVGDLSGQTSAGSACSTSNADCSTRNDTWNGEYLTNIDNLQTNTVFTITGFVATPTLSHTSGEGPNIGMMISCPAGLNANMAQCPTFGRFDDIQIENFKTYGVVLSDYLSFYFAHLYSVGDGTNSNNNNLYALSNNYTASGVPVGRLTVTDSVLFATGGDCALLSGTMWDIEIINNQISGCNIVNSNWNAIDSVGTITDLKVIHNTIGEVDGYGGAFPLNHALVLSNGTSNVQVVNNLWNPSGGVGYCHLSGSCTNVAPVANNSTTPWTVHDEGNVGPGGAPTMGSCGTSPSITQGSDRAMLIASGTGSPTTCVIDFGSIWPVAPICNVAIAPGAGVISSIATSNTTLTINGGALAGSYMAQCSVN